MIALLSALRDELKGVAKLMIIRQRLSHLRWSIHEGILAKRDIVLMQTGMGKEPAKQAAEYILEHFSPSVVISLGFGGALTTDLKVGDLVLSSELFHHSYPDSRRSQKSHHELLDTATRVMEANTARIIVGSGLTIDRLVSDPEEKATLGKTYNAQVVDMESYWIAETVAFQKVPFLGVRAISDTLDYCLPPFDSFLDAEGKWQLKKILRYFLFNPRDLRIIPLLYVNSQQARKSLTEFLCALLPAIPQQ